MSQRFKCYYINNNNDRIIESRKNQPVPGLLLNCGSAAVLEEELPGKKTKCGT